MGASRKKLYLTIPASIFLLGVAFSLLQITSPSPDSTIYKTPFNITVRYEPPSLTQSSSPPYYRFLLIAEHYGNEYVFKLNLTQLGIDYNNNIEILVNGKPAPFCYIQPNGECASSPKTEVIYVRANLTKYDDLIIIPTGINYATNGSEVLDFYDDFSTMHGIVKVRDPSGEYGIQSYRLSNGYTDYYLRFYSAPDNGYANTQIPYFYIQLPSEIAQRVANGDNLTVIFRFRDYYIGGNGYGFAFLTRADPTISLGCGNRAGYLGSWVDRNIKILFNGQTIDTNPMSDFGEFIGTLYRSSSTNYTFVAKVLIPEHNIEKSFTTSLSEDITQTGLFFDLGNACYDGTGTHWSGIDFDTVEAFFYTNVTVIKPNLTLYVTNFDKNLNGDITIKLNISNYTNTSNLSSIAVYSPKLIAYSYSAMSGYKMIITSNKDEVDYNLKIQLPQDLWNKPITIYDSNWHKIPFCYLKIDGDCSFLYQDNYEGYIWIKANLTNGVNVFYIVPGVNGATWPDKVFPYYDTFNETTLKSIWQVSGLTYQIYVPYVRTIKVDVQNSASVPFNNTFVDVDTAAITGRSDIYFSVCEDFFCNKPLKFCYVGTNGQCTTTPTGTVRVEIPYIDANGNFTFYIHQTYYPTPSNISVSAPNPSLRVSTSVIRRDGYISFKASKANSWGKMIISFNLTKYPYLQYGAQAWVKAKASTGFGEWFNLPKLIGNCQSNPSHYFYTVIRGDTNSAEFVANCNCLSPCKYIDIRKVQALSAGTWYIFTTGIYNNPITGKVFFGIYRTNISANPLRVYEATPPWISASNPVITGTDLAEYDGRTYYADYFFVTTFDTDLSYNVSFQNASLQSIDPNSWDKKVLYIELNLSYGDTTPLFFVFNQNNANETDLTRLTENYTIIEDRNYELTVSNSENRTLENYNLPITLYDPLDKMKFALVDTNGKFYYYCFLDNLGRCVDYPTSEAYTNLTLPSNSIMKYYIIPAISSEDPTGKNVFPLYTTFDTADWQNNFLVSGYWSNVLASEGVYHQYSSTNSGDWHYIAYNVSQAGLENFTVESLIEIDSTDNAAFGGGLFIARQGFTTDEENNSMQLFRLYASYGNITRYYTDYGEGQEIVDDSIAQGQPYYYRITFTPNKVIYEIKDENGNSIFTKEVNKTTPLDTPELAGVRDYNSNMQVYYLRIANYFPARVNYSYIGANIGSIRANIYVDNEYIGSYPLVAGDNNITLNYSINGTHTLSIIDTIGEVATLPFTLDIYDIRWNETPTNFTTSIVNATVDARCGVENQTLPIDFYVNGTRESTQLLICDGNWHTITLQANLPLLTGKTFNYTAVLDASAFDKAYWLNNVTATMEQLIKVWFGNDTYTFETSNISVDVYYKCSVVGGQINVSVEDLNKTVGSYVAPCDNQEHELLYNWISYKDGERPIDAIAKEITLTNGALNDTDNATLIDNLYDYEASYQGVYYIDGKYVAIGGSTLIYRTKVRCGALGQNITVDYYFGGSKYNTFTVVCNNTWQTFEGNLTVPNIGGKINSYFYLNAVDENDSRAYGNMTVTVQTQEAQQVVAGGGGPAIPDWATIFLVGMALFYLTEKYSHIIPDFLSILLLVFYGVAAVKYLYMSGTTLTQYPPAAVAIYTVLALALFKAVKWMKDMLLGKERGPI